MNLDEFEVRRYQTISHKLPILTVREGTGRFSAVRGSVVGSTLLPHVRWPPAQHAPRNVAPHLVTSADLEPVRDSRIVRPILGCMNANPPVIRVWSTTRRNLAAGSLRTISVSFLRFRAEIVRKELFGPPGFLCLQTLAETSSGR